MELKIDLYDKYRKKSILRMAFGIFFFLIAIAGFIVISYKGTLKLFMWFSYGIFAINGIVQFLEGFGYQFESLFGKAYIWINDDFISLKSSAFNQAQLINWGEIQCIEYKLNKFVIQKTDDTIQVIDLSKFEYVLNMKIKETIIDIAKEKNMQRMNC